MANQPADPFFPAGKYRDAARMIVGKDGVSRLEKRPIQKSSRVLNPAGIEIWCVEYAGPAQIAEYDPYRVQTVRAKKKAGFLWLNECPQNLESELRENLPLSIRGRAPCKRDPKKGEPPFSHLHPCACVEIVRAERIAKHNAEMARINDAHYGAARRAAETQTALLNEARQSNALIRDAIVGGALKPAKGDK